MSSSSACPYLNFGIMLSPTSEVRPCCRFDTSLYKNIDFIWDNKTSLEDFYKRSQFKKLREKSKKGELIKGCHRCYREESLGIKSMRQKDFPNDTIIDSSIERVELQVVELGVGRICNLKCRSCDPYYSQLWDTDAESVQKPIPESFLDVDLNALDINSFRNTKYLKVTGGEPFYHPQFEDFLSLLVKNGFAEKIQLEIFTNATKVPNSKFFNLVKQFSKVDLSLSIDAYAEKNTYIRFPSRWKNIEQTTQFWFEQSRLFSQININIATTVSIFNINSLFELFDWLYSLDNHPNIILQFVQDPLHLNVSAWPLKIRKAIYIDFKNQRNIFEKKWQPNSVFRSRLDKIEKILLSSRQEKDITFKFWEETITLDRRRNESISKTFPGLFSIINSTTPNI